MIDYTFEELVVIYNNPSANEHTRGGLAPVDQRRFNPFNLSRSEAERLGMLRVGISRTHLIPTSLFPFVADKLPLLTIDGHWCQPDEFEGITRSLTGLSFVKYGTYYHDEDGFDSLPSHYSQFASIEAIKRHYGRKRNDGRNA